VLVGKTVDDAIGFQLAIGPAGEVFREAGPAAEAKRAEIQSCAGGSDQSSKEGRRRHRHGLIVLDHIRQESGLERSRNLSSVSHGLLGFVNRHEVPDCRDVAANQQNRSGSYT